MRLIPVSTFSRLFRSLPVDERQAFLAALWEARGYETDIKNDVIVAERDGSSIRIAVVGLVTFGPPPADVYVGTRDVSWLRSRTAHRDAEFYDPERLRSELAYGIDREVGEQLAREYLGSSLTVPDRERPPFSIPKLVAGVLVAVICTAVIVIGIGLPLIEDTPTYDNRDDADGPTITTLPSETDDVATDDESHQNQVDPLPPGLDEDGVTDAEAFVRNHREKNANRSRLFELKYSGPLNDTIAPERTYLGAWGTIAESGEYRAQIREIGASENETVDRHFDHYGNEREVYKREWMNGETEISHRTDVESSIVEDFERFAFDVAEESLRSEEADVELIHEIQRMYSIDVFGLYRITVSEPPSELEDSVDQYSAMAVATPDGTIVRFEVNYVLADRNETVRLFVSYNEIGEDIPVEKPEWVVESEDETPAERSFIPVDTPTTTSVG